MPKMRKYEIREIEEELEVLTDLEASFDEIGYPVPILNNRLLRLRIFRDGKAFPGLLDVSDELIRKLQEVSALIVSLDEMVAKEKKERETRLP